MKLIPPLAPCSQSFVAIARLSRKKRFTIVAATATIYGYRTTPSRIMRRFFKNISGRILAEQDLFRVENDGLMRKCIWLRCVSGRGRFYADDEHGALPWL